MQIRWFLTGIWIIVLSAFVIGQTSVVFGVVREGDGAQVQVQVIWVEAAEGGAGV